MTRIPDTVACPGRDDWSHIVRDEFNHTHGPCNLAGLIRHLTEVWR